MSGELASTRAMKRSKGSRDSAVPVQEKLTVRKRPAVSVLSLPLLTAISA